MRVRHTHHDGALVAEVTAPSTWRVGDLILDTYRIKHIHEGGGMGLVYRVHHQGWNMDLAIKAPRSAHFQTDMQKQNFVRECETWVNLGLHPHIVSCFYVRNMGGTPCVFAEYVHGGSLSDWIRSRKLYEGEPRNVLERILDIAIQTAWGLDSAHAQGLIHQDVKPANIMMTPNGSAKITDFGLAKARGSTAETTRAGPTRSIVVSTGGMTPAYCSPEQARGQPLTRRTDIWSWSVSVLEMVTGEVLWMSGPAAVEVLSKLNEYGGGHGRCCHIPPALKDLLSHCLQSNQEQRPHDLAVVAEALIDLYRGMFQKPFPRALPDALDWDADALNNRCASLVDIGKVLTEDYPNAYSLLLELRQKRPDHIQGRLNDALVHWRKLGRSVQELNRQLDNMRQSLFKPDLLKWQIRLEIEKCDTCRALHLLEAVQPGARQMLLNQITQQHAGLHQRLATFFQNDQRAGRPCAYQALMSPNESTAAPLFAVTGSEAGLAAICQDDGQRIEIKDLCQGRQLGEITPPHKVTHIALSESGSFLAVALKYGATYKVSVCNPLDMRGWTTYAGDVYNRNLLLTAITIDDQCLCLALWLTEGNHVFQLIHDLNKGALKPFRCDFRQPSQIGSFERVYVNGDRTLLLCVAGSRCSLWRYPSATRDDAVNVLDIDLADFGLIDTTDHFPGFALDKGFEYRIDEWNAHHLMRLLDKLRPKTGAEYLLCQPTDTSALFTANATKATLLQLAADAEKANDRRMALCHLNKYCAIQRSYSHTVMSRRHALAQVLSGTYVERVWHHCGHKWYWASNIFGVLPSEHEYMTIQGHQRLLTIALPGGGWKSMCELYELPAGVGKGSVETHPDKVTHVGIYDCGDGMFLTVAHDHIPPWENRLTLCSKGENEWLDIQWSVPFQGRDLYPEQYLRKVIHLGESVYAEVCPGVVMALDINSGLARAQVRLAQDVLFLKALRTPEGKDMLFAASQSVGALLLDTSLERIENWWGNAQVVQRLCPVEAVADDLSSVVGWMGSHRLVHIQRESLQVTDVWNLWDRKYPRVSHNLEFLTDMRTLVLKIALSPCGRAVAYVLWDYVVVLDVLTGELVLQWQRPWDNANALAFDSSGRWLVFAHAENQLEVFHLLWDVKDAPFEAESIAR